MNGTLLFNATSFDSDGDPVQLRHFINGTLSLTTNTTGNINLQPADYFHEVDAFDGTDFSSNASQVLTVTATNNAPNTPLITAPSGSGVSEGVTFSVTATDPDGDDLIIRYFVDGEIVAETNSTSIVHTFTLGAHVLAADSFDGFLRSGNASGNYLVAEVGLPLENSVNVVAMMLLLLLIVGLFMASVGGKK